MNIESLWHLLALPDAALDEAGPIRLNLAVARGVPSLADLDGAPYLRAVDGWAAGFAAWLPGPEAVFRQTPWKWQDDLRFFRLGMLVQFLSEHVGVRYVEGQRGAKSVRYADPGHLFVHGLIDTRRGTCATMPLLHVAIGRRLGWPVSLACVGPHFVCRFDDGQVVYNVEATDTGGGGFSAGTDEQYLQHYGLPRRAIDCGSDLRPLSAKETLGAFVAVRARFFEDTGDDAAAAADLALSQALFPRYRHGYLQMLPAVLARGAELFEPGERGHPRAVLRELAPSLARRVQADEEGVPGLTVLSLRRNGLA